MSWLKVNGLTKRFGDFTALDQINLTMEPGQIYGFIGPNGAGKSTTIRVLLGMLKADAGSVKIFGMDAWQDSVEIHKRIAYVPGEANLWPNLTGGEVIDLFLEMHGSPNRLKRDALIEKFALDPTKKCRAYSKGNRQKVMLIAAFATDAELFILDEPTSGLDPLMEQVFQQLLLDAKAEGKSVLLSSHILSEVEKVCDRIAIIRQGKIIEEGSMQDLRHITRMQMTIETKKPIASWEQVVGVHEVQRIENGWTFQVDAEALDAVVRQISTYGLLKLESHPPTLEDLFLHHYKGGATHEKQ